MNDQLHPIFRNILNGINKHIFKPSEADNDFCAHCGKNFRDINSHITSEEHENNVKFPYNDKFGNLVIEMNGEKFIIGLMADNDLPYSICLPNTDEFIPINKGIGKKIYNKLMKENNNINGK